MAEKYGEVPPKFTKKWWEYFWDYYKWHVIITVVAVLIASVTIVQCATRPKYDMNVVYAGHMNYSEEEINKLKEIISERISDIDGNGENSVLLSTLVFADNAGSEEYDYAIQTKLDLTFTDDCSFIYLMDKANVDAQMQKEVVDQIYDCTDSFIDSSSDKYASISEIKATLSVFQDVFMKYSTTRKKSSVFQAKFRKRKLQEYSTFPKNCLRMSTK